LRPSGSRASLSWLVRRCVPRAPSLTSDPSPPRTTRKSYRPRASNRTMVSYLITELLVGFRTDWPRREQAMKTAGRGTQNCYATVRSQPSTWGGRLEQILLNHAGWKARKNPVVGEVFFLTSPFIELTRSCPNRPSKMMGCSSQLPACRQFGSYRLRLESKGPSFPPNTATSDMLPHHATP
jgi:hypothetical protein